MAERIQVELVDDIDGSPAKHTVTFALDGVSYEIDLNDGHAKELRSVFERYIDKARSPESAPADKTKRQREHEEETNRRANKQLTEQIRGAAQRSRDQLNRQRTAEPGTDAAERGDAEAGGARRDAAERADESPAAGTTEPAARGWAFGERPEATSEPAAAAAVTSESPDSESADSGSAVSESVGSESAEQDDAAAPAVALPLFSSAAD